MTSLGDWIHSFTVTETQTHKNGYTIYKITSVIFPRAVPQALTCLSVWKRFHDVKRLHRELSRRHKSLQLSGQLPEPAATDCSFFKRFDAGVIRHRKEYILKLLDFIAEYPALYKCHAFAQFFNDGGQSPLHSPLHQLHVHQDKGGAIAEICEQLNLHYDPCENELLDPERDKVLAISDGRNDGEAVVEQEQPTEKSCKDYTRFLTPMASIESDDSDYIYEAALEFSHAVQAEANLEYKEAHVRYKRGVEVLLNGSKDDCNDERKFIAKAKISKYLARADDIYNKFLRIDIADEVTSGKTNFQLSIDITDSASDSSAVYLERPWNHLAKYKVLQVLGDRVMQVQSITEPQRPVYVMKGVEKPSSNSTTQTIFLPQQVPYMVDLMAFFQSEQKLFLLLKQAEGGRLHDYVETYTTTANKTTHFSGLFPELATGQASTDVDVKEAIFVDCGGIAHTKKQLTPTECNDSIIEDYDNASQVTKQLTPTEYTEFNELVRYSQELLQSVSNTLKVVKDLKESPTEALQISDDNEANKGPSKIVKNTKLPEACLKQWARELAVAIHCLHGKGVILRDLNMDNILLGAKGQLMLTYFYQNEGIGADNHVHKAASPSAAAGHYVAPERQLTFKSDWWSYGVVLYQLLLGVSFKATHPGQIELYGCVQYPENTDISPDACDLLENLLQQKPEDRFDYEQIQMHAFFKGTNWEELCRNGVNSSNTSTNARI